MNNSSSDRQQVERAELPSNPVVDSDSDHPLDSDYHQDRLMGLLPDILFKTRALNSQNRQIHSQRKSQLFWSYLPDWIVVISMGVLFGFLDRLHGHHRLFDINDSSIQFTFATHERVPVPLLIVLAVIIPALLIVGFSQAMLRSTWDTHTGLLGLVLSISLSIASTTIVKVTVGRPRPDMLSRCQPALGSANALGPSFGLSNSSICTAEVNSRKFQDGFRSFPSGHSSTAWAGLGFLSLYLAGKLHLLDRRRHHSIKIWISIAPLFAAALIAISRTMDYRHHWEDVVVGSVLGALTAWFSYRFYYPSLSSASCHKPYSPRVHSPERMRRDQSLKLSRAHHSRNSSGVSTDLESQLIGGRAQVPVHLASVEPACKDEYAGLSPESVSAHSHPPFLPDPPQKLHS